MPYILLLILIIWFIYSFKWFLLIIMISVIAFVVYNKNKNDQKLCKDRKSVSTNQHVKSDSSDLCKSPINFSQNDNVLKISNINKPTNLLNNVKTIKNSVNPEIFNLLWFADGPYKNYDKSNETINLENGPVKIKIETSWMFEPSALYLDLPVSKPIDSTTVERPPYFPSYEKINEFQKWVYLNWLKNPYEQIDIGYVFIFYYGLERHLLSKNFDDAFDTILRLREVHKSNSFLYYSSDALVLSSILHKRPDKLESFFKSLTIEDIKVSFPVYLLAKYLFQLKLSSEEIILIAKNVSFKNTRYIKNEYDLFKKILDSVLIELNGEPYLGLSVFNMQDCPRIKTNFLANISIPEDQRFITVPDLTQNKYFNEVVYNLLSGTHEAVKKELRESRKKDSKKTQEI